MARSMNGARADSARSARFVDLDAPESDESRGRTLDALPAHDYLLLVGRQPQPLAELLARLQPDDCDEQVGRLRQDALVRLAACDFTVPASGITYRCEVCGDRDRIGSGKRRSWVVRIHWATIDAAKLAPTHRGPLVCRMRIEPRTGRLSRDVVMLAVRSPGAAGEARDPPLRALNRWPTLFGVGTARRSLLHRAPACYCSLRASCRIVG
jgi:hypothetical protein